MSINTQSLSGKYSLETIRNEFKNNLNMAQTLEEYFLLIGVDPKISSNKKLYITPISELNEYYSKSDFKPKILSKFPPMKKSYINIDESIIELCFNDGYKLLKFNKKPEPIVENFILDNSFYSIDYPLKYITCLKIYESLHDYYLLNEERKKLDYNVYNDLSINGDNICKKPENTSNVSCNSDNEYKNYYFPKVLCLVSTKNFFYEQEEILRQIYQYSLEKNSIKIPLEKKILTILCNIPVPPKGLLEIEYNLNENYKKIILKRQKMNKITIIKREINLIFPRFQISTFLEIFKYLIFETKILIFSSKINDLSNFIYGLISLLFPFHYSFQISSSIPKNAYNILESISPYILGINKKFEITFFKENRIDLTDLNILIIDLDRNSAKFLGNKNVPHIPKFLYKTLYDGINNIQFKQNLWNEEENEKNYKFIRKLFYDFFVNIMTNYELYIKTNFFKKKMTNTGIYNLFNIEEFVNSKNSNDRDFYITFFETQMFSDFIYKKMIPKDLNEKLEILFLDESITKNNNKKLFTKKKNYVFLNSKDYNYCHKFEVPQSKLLSKEEKQFFVEEKNRNISLLKYGQKINIELNPKTNKEEYSFKYYIFPILNEFFFENPPRGEYFILPDTIFSDFERVNTDILSKSLINSSNGMNKNITFELEMKNYIYLSYIELWAYSYWYLDSIEKEEKFNEMLCILSKVSFHETELFDLLFESLNKFKEKNKILKLYDFFLTYQIPPSSYIYKTVGSYLPKNNKNSLPYSNISTININNSNNNTSFKNRHFQKKTFHSSNEGKCLGDKIVFYTKQKCPECGQDIDIKEISLNFKNIKKDVFWANCPICEKNIIPKLGVNLGNEIINKDIYRDNIYNENISSNYTKFILHSPYELKTNLKKIKKKDGFKMFQVEYFKQEYPSLFWSCIWYFKLYKINYDLILPYEWSISKELFNQEEYIPTNIDSKININNSKNNLDINDTKNLNKNKKLKKLKKNKKYINDNLIIHSTISLSIIINYEKNKRFSNYYNSFSLYRKSTKASSNKSSLNNSELFFRKSGDSSTLIKPNIINKFNSCSNISSRERLNTLNNKYLLSPNFKSSQIFNYSSSNSLRSIKENEEYLVSTFSKYSKKDSEYFLENLYSNNSNIIDFSSEEENTKSNSKINVRKKSFENEKIRKNKFNEDYKKYIIIRRNKSINNYKIKFSFI